MPQYPFNLYLLALVSGAIGSALTLPLWRAWCRRIGLVDDPGQRKIHQTPIPLAGGLAVLTGMMIPLLCGAAALALNLVNIHNSGPALNHGLEKRGAELS